MLLLKCLFFTVLIPGTVAGFVPYLILKNVPLRGTFLSFWGHPRIIGVVPIILGGIVLFRSIWDFMAAGRGTLAPIDPPKELVVRGFYRYVRNPMYCAVLLIILGEAWFFNSAALLRYALGTFIFIHLLLVFYEEPVLRKRFGESYAAYCRAVRRWWPGKRF